MDLQGTFVYQLHGYMRVGNLEAEVPEQPKELTYGSADAQVTQTIEHYVLLALPTYRPSPFPSTIDVPAPEGFYPYSELGLMNFGENSSISAIARLNISGHMGEVNEFKGRYALDGPHVWDTDPSVVQPPKAQPAVQTATGILTLRGVIRTQLIWDYAFAFINKDEALLMAGGRTPRPASLSGRMWRQDPSLSR